MLARQALKEKLTAEVNHLKAEKVAKLEPETAFSIEAIPRPKGEAGDRKRGFILIEAMELNKGSKNQTLYNSILVSHNVTSRSPRSSIHPSLGHRSQEHRSC